MKKEMVFELLEHLDRFESSFGDKTPYTLHDFVGYLVTQTASTDLDMRSIAGDKAPMVQQIGDESNSDVATLITLMFRYAKGYSKKAFQDSLIQTVDEFAFLVTLITFDSLTKTELINTQVMERTSGVEIIKRLLNQKLITEFADENDKRSVRVAITDSGKAEIIRTLPEMSKVTKIVVGDLSPGEIKTLSYLLKKLDFFHNDIFMNKRSLTLNEILEEISLRRKIEAN